MKRPGFSLVFFIVATTVFAFNQPLDLKGIRTVNVTVADLSDDLVKDGVEKEALAAILDKALREAGLVVLAQDQYRGTVPTVSLRVSDIKEPNGRFFATHIALDCLDNVYNSRTAGPFSAIIWSNDVLQLLGAIDLDRVVEAEKTLIDLFLADYAHANQQ